RISFVAVDKTNRGNVIQWKVEGNVPTGMQVRFQVVADSPEAKKLRLENDMGWYQAGWVGVSCPAAKEGVHSFEHRFPEPQKGDKFPVTLDKVRYHVIPWIYDPQKPECPWHWGTARELVIGAKPPEKEGVPAPDDKDSLDELTH